MNLKYKPDWEQTKERYKAWWAHEYFGRCAISVVARRTDAPDEPPPATPADPHRRWLDYDFLHAINEWGMGRTFYGGEAFPVWNPGYPGWSSIPCFLGASVKLDHATGWVDPLIGDGALTDHDYRDLVIQSDNHWWVTTQNMLRFAVEEARGPSTGSGCGMSIPGNLAIGGCGDTLAMLRGYENLLYDVAECPDYVREFDQYLMRQWMEVFDTLYEITREGAEGSTCWFTLWSPGKFYPTHNDFAYCISPKMFREVFLPSLEMQTQYLDHTVHHVDGIGNFVHVDALCELPRLQALQILPGAGKPSPLHYMDVLKKVQAAGKNLHIGLPANQVKDALENLSARGLFIATSCQTEEEARELIKNCERWSRDR